MMLKGITDIGGIVEASVFLSEKLYRKLVERDNFKYQKVNANGHFEIKIHETSGRNIKQSLKLIADDFRWVS